MTLTCFEDLEAALRERTNFELRAPPASGFHLARMQALVEALGRPDKAYRVIHVAGTCGKGTTTAALASCLDAAGLRVGWTTSPHLISLRERIRIGATPAPDPLWLQAATTVLAKADALEDPPTYFELVIAMAFEAFRSAEVEVAVVEVGLGGRLDATNVVTPDASVITRIGLDHVALLGDDLSSVAREKAGIIKPRVPVVAGPEDPIAQAVIEARASDLNAPLLLLDRDVFVEVTDDDGRVCSATIRTPWNTFVVRAPLGTVVARNMGLVAGAFGVLGLPLAHLNAGLSRLRWRGRFDVIDRAAPNPSDDSGLADDQVVVVDGAHDPASVDALIRRYGARFGTRPPLVLLGILEDKSVEAILDRIAAFCCEAICCRIDSPRSSNPGTLAAGLRSRARPANAVEDGAEALAEAEHRARTLGAPLVVVGSLYLAGQVLEALGQDVGAGWATA